jgi:hypothetical protein
MNNVWCVQLVCKAIIYYDRIFYPVHLQSCNNAQLHVVRWLFFFLFGCSHFDRTSGENPAIQTRYQCDVCNDGVSGHQSVTSEFRPTAAAAAASVYLTRRETTPYSRLSLSNQARFSILEKFLTLRLVSYTKFHCKSKMPSNLGLTTCYVMTSSRKAGVS